MTRWLLLLLAAALPAQPSPTPQAPPLPEVSDAGEALVDAEGLASRVAWLAADERKGRMTGSPEAQEVAASIARHFQEVGLKPAGTAGTWEHGFAAPGRVGQNVAGLLPGADPALKNQIVVIGAHFDHVGIGAFGSRTPNRRGEVHNGADDNASGTAALLELAEALAKCPPKRSILFLAFSGEEMGLLGSAAWVKKPTLPLNRVVAMVNLDMIGRSRDGYLFVGGLNTAEGWKTLVPEVAAPFGFDLELNGGGRGPSDHQSFYDAGIPVLFCFTAEHADYHTPDDDAEKINVEALTGIARLAYRLVHRLGNGPRPRFQKDDRQAMPDSSERRLDQARTLLGVQVQDAQGQAGARIQDVARGKAGFKAGLLVDDVLSAVDGTAVRSARELQRALALVRPGTAAQIEVQRGKRTLKLKIVTED
jgi:aminopeptidase YwaD